MEQVYKLWKMRTTSSSGILKTIYHNGSYIVTWKEKNYKVLKFHGNNSS